MTNFVKLNVNELNRVNGGIISGLRGGDGGCILIPRIPTPRFPRRPAIYIL